MDKITELDLKKNSKPLTNSDLLAELSNVEKLEAILTRLQILTKKTNPEFNNENK
jgi:hypothetical protein